MKALLNGDSERDFDDPTIHNCRKNENPGLQFANFVVKEMTEADLNNALLSDEATFSLDVTDNSQNIRRYAEKKVMAEDIEGKLSEFCHTKHKYSL